jgi:uncharacterized MAPEG superfamily protein
MGAPSAARSAAHAAHLEIHMTTPFWCLLIVCVLPYVWSFAAVPSRRQQLGTIDNKNPRQQQLQLTGFGARAIGAHKNAFEAVALFGPAVTVAHLTGGDPGRAAQLSVAFVIARALHGVFYVTDLDALRSLSFVAAQVCAIWLFILGA